MIIMSTLEGDNKKTNVNSTFNKNDTTSELSSNLGTMVINDNEGDDDTMVTRRKYCNHHRENSVLKSQYFIRLYLNRLDLNF